MVIRANFPWPVLDPVVTQQCSRQGAHLHPSIKGFVPPAVGVGDQPRVVSSMATPVPTITTTTPAAARPQPSTLPPARPPGTMATEPGSVSFFSATRTTATEPGGLAWTVNQQPTPDIPSAPRNLQPPQTTPLSYATVTKARHHPPSASPSSSQPTSPSTTPSPIKPTETTRHHRTQILRRLPYNTTTKQIIDDVTRQLGYTEDALFERVLRDPNDSRRFYLTYRTDDLRQTATRKGFFINHLHIKPTDGFTNGYIPFPPYYIDEETIRDLLTPYGTIVTGGFVETKLHTRIAGYKFSIEFHKETSPPTSIAYNGCTMNIKYDDDLRQCKYCGRYGHLIGKCRTKAADDATNKHRRDEIRTSTWKEDRQKLTEESIRERDKLGAQYDGEITALSDVHEAALISIEGTADYTERLQHLEAAYQTELEELHNHYMDSLSFLEDDISERKCKLDAQYQRAGGIIPRGIQTPDASFYTESEADPMEEESDHDLITRAEDRLTSTLQDQCSHPDPPSVLEDAVIATDPIAPPPQTSPVTSTDADTVPVRSVEDRPPSRLQGTKSTKTTTTSKTTSKPTSKSTNSTPFYSLPPAAQENLIKQATQRLHSAFDYRTYSTHQIQLKTNTPHLTQILRSHLFDLQRKRGYHYINPMETVVCTSDVDDTKRIIYVRDAEMAAHLISFLDQCRTKQLINFLEDPVQGPNPAYDHKTGWE